MYRAPTGCGAGENLKTHTLRIEAGNRDRQDAGATTGRLAVIWTKRE
jgi:hypothetical protein